MSVFLYSLEGPWFPWPPTWSYMRRFTEAAWAQNEAWMLSEVNIKSVLQVLVSHEAHAANWVHNTSQNHHHHHLGLKMPKVGFQISFRVQNDYGWHRNSASVEALKLEAEGNAVSAEELKKPFESWLKV